MSLDDKFAPIRNAIYDVASNFNKGIAGFFGYPKNPGMPTVSDISNNEYAKLAFRSSLPKHETSFPPYQEPETWFEMVFGDVPKLELIPRYIYESREDGFYNFYIENYQNLYFLPDSLSEFIQVRLNLCLEISSLEIIRELLFIGLMIFSQLIVLRITMGWLISINPYTVPWCYVTAAVDWTDEVLQGLIPSLLGVNLTGTIFLGLLGAVADGLNHLVFTMPFLPSEGEAAKLIIDGQLKDVLIFHHLPILWYKYPIPNYIREFWYNQRPEILEYLQKAYKDVDIQFLPDGTFVSNPELIISELKEEILGQLYPNAFPSQIITKENLLDSHEFINYVSFIHEGFDNFFLTHTNNLF
jgi:hypothetical protein